MNNVTDLIELSDQDLVTKTLRDHIEGKVDLTPVQVQSINILAKASGMYTTRIEEVKPKLSPEELKVKLTKSLKELFEDKRGIYGISKEDKDDIYGISETKKSMSK